MWIYLPGHATTSFAQVTPQLIFQCVVVRPLQYQLFPTPMTLYISQNQNTLMASMLGDVANLTYGIITRNPASMAAGGMGVLNRIASLEDAKNEIPSTPPAF